MKKIVILFFTLLMSFPMAFYCFAMDSNEGFSTESYDVILQEDGNFALKYGNQIYIEGQIYEKDNCIMIPLKMAVDIENQNYDEKREAIYEKQATQAKFTLDEKEIVFFEGKRNILLDGQQRALYEIPDIKQHDIFVSAEDFYILFNIRFSNQSHKFPWDAASKQAGWVFKGDDGVHIREIKEQTKQYSFTLEKDTPIEYAGTLFDGNSEKNISAYEKNGHFMIAWKDVPYFAEPKILLQSVWKKENNQLFVKTWDGIAQDVTFEKDSNIMMLNDVPIKMEEKAEIQNNRLYIPITALFQMLNIPEENVQIEKGNVSVLY